MVTASMSGDEHATDPRYPLTRRELAAAAGFWALFAVVRVADRIFAEPSPALALRRIIPTAFESAAWLALTPVIVGLVERSLARRRAPAAQAARYAALGIPAALVVSAVGSWLRVSPLVRSFPPDAAPPRLSPPYWFWFGDAFIVYLLVVGAALTRSYVLRYQGQREAAAVLEARLSAARLEALRRQLDPHFLFNTLSLVTSLVEKDPAGARRMIARLSDLLRASLADDGAPEVPLHQELALVDRYLDIMRVRFAGRLDVDVRVDPAARDALVPPLVLQPLVENAVKHGVERARGPARIAIEAARDGDAVVLRVRNDAPDGPDPASPAPDGHGLGLRTTRARLEALYGRDTGLALRDAAGGAEVEVRLPLRPAGA